MAVPAHYPAPRAAMLVLGGFAIFMTLLGVALSVLAGPFGLIAGLPAALFFGACTVVIFYRSFTPTPVLSLTEEGLAPWRYPLLRWDEIDFAEAAQSSGELFLVLHAKDHEAYLARFGFFKRKWARLSAALFPDSVYLSRQMFTVPVQDVAKTINAELARRRGGNTRW